MGKILVTGITGNVGYEVAKNLKGKQANFVCGVRNVKKATEKLGDHFNYVPLDYNQPATFPTALQGIDQIFLLFPPETNMENFHAFLKFAKEQQIKHIVYFSVKDVQLMPFIPHFKNEKKIKKLGIPFTFIRAGYFMQNLNMFLLDEIKENNRIFITAGKGETSFVDLRDLAEIIALSLLDSEAHQNKKYTLTGEEALDFFQVANQMSEVLDREIVYSNPSSQEFKQYMKSKGLPVEFITLVDRIHFFTKIGLAKGITKEYEKITGKKPASLRQFLKDHQHLWEK